MTLSARIVVGPSLRIAIASSVLAVGGIAATAATVATRWPDASFATIGTALLLSAAVVVRSVAACRTAERCVLTVSARSALDVGSDGALDGAWRLAAPTWSCGGARDGISVIGLVRDHGAPRSARLPVLHAELSDSDARALRRYLRWALRGGAADPVPSAVHRAAHSTVRGR